MTSFEPALKKCLDILNKSKFSKGDVVFITDGEDGVSSSFINKLNVQKKEKDFKIVSVVISSNETEALKDISDEVHFIYDLAKDSEDVNKLNHDLFSSI